MPQIRRKRLYCSRDHADHYAGARDEDGNKTWPWLFKDTMTWGLPDGYRYFSHGLRTWTNLGDANSTWDELIREGNRVVGIRGGVDVRGDGWRGTELSVTIVRDHEHDLSGEWEPEVDEGIVGDTPA